MDMMTDSWMPPQAHQSWSSTDFAQTFVVWAVMMVAMMMPSVIPMTYGFLRLRWMMHFNRHLYFDTFAFVLGYFLIWLIFCIFATVSEWQLHALDLLSPMMESRNAILSADVIILAGLYQLTPWKANCLEHCRKTVYLRQDCHSKPIIMGLHHGIYCVGSCWALMFMMFAVGVMHLLWMGLITFMVALEKVFPSKPIWLRLGSAIVLLIWGGYLLMPLDLATSGLGLD